MRRYMLLTDPLRRVHSSHSHSGETVAQLSAFGPALIVDELLVLYMIVSSKICLFAVMSFDCLSSGLFLNFLDVMIFELSTFQGSSAHAVSLLTLVRARMRLHPPELCCSEL